jgi:hypothetical protein
MIKLVVAHLRRPLEEGGTVTFCGIDARAGLTNREQAWFFAGLLIPLLLICAGSEATAIARQRGASGPAANAPLSQEQVVENLVAMDLKRSHALHAYQGSRHYHLQYHGFAGTRSAEMVVDLKYQSPGTKEFTIRSSAGSKLIIGRVFKKLLQAEQESLGVEAQKRTALNRDNYDFTLIGYESTSSGSMYVLDVKPRTNGKFLYRGRIWVDAEDFAVTRLEAHPAKNPSFWTKHSEIEEVYMQVGEFWLPACNRSITNIRLGGSAVLTIQYTNYEITSAGSVLDMPTLKSSRSGDDICPSSTGEH